MGSVIKQTKRLPRRSSGMISHIAKVGLPTSVVCGLEMEAVSDSDLHIAFRRWGESTCLEE